MTTYETQLNNDLQWALLEGSMHFEGGSAVHKTLRRLVERLNQFEIDYAIAGGMALFFHGYRRFTEDVDVLVTAGGLEKVHANLDSLGYVRPFEKSKNLRDTVTGVKINFLVTGGFPGDGKPGPIAFPIPKDIAIETEGIQIVSLKAIIELKLASGQAPHRSGDLNDVQRLIQALHLPQEFSEKLEPSIQKLYLEKWQDAQTAEKEELQLVFKAPYDTPWRFVTMRTDFGILRHLLELLQTRHESSRTHRPTGGNFFDARRGRLALQPSLLFVEPRRTRQPVAGNSGRRPSRRDLGT